MGRVGAIGLALLLTSACATVAPFPPNLMGQQFAQDDAPLMRAIEQALALDKAGASPHEALKPILALPKHCARLRSLPDEPCAPPGFYDGAWPVRDEALRTLADARLLADKEPGASAPLKRLALDVLAEKTDTAYLAAVGYSRLGDRALSERALAKAPISDSQREMRIGLWFNDPDKATRGALASIPDVHAWPGVKENLWDEAEAAAVAAGRTDLETQIALSRLRWYWDAEASAVRALIRLIELGEHEAVRARLDEIDNWESNPPSAWVAFMGYLHLGDRDRAEKIAAPWQARERPCEVGTLQIGFVGHAPYCATSLGFHMREALEAGEHLVPTP